MHTPGLSRVGRVASRSEISQFLKAIDYLNKELLFAASGVKNLTPYSPFKVKKTPNNLGYLGRGYDVLYGNPLDESGRVDPGKLTLVPIIVCSLFQYFLFFSFPGFRLPVVDLEYLQNKFSADGMYRIPDNADVIMEPSALFSSSFNDVRTIEDYKHQLKEDVKTTAGFGLSGWSRLLQT